MEEISIKEKVLEALWSYQGMFSLQEKEFKSQDKRMMEL